MARRDCQLVGQAAGQVVSSLALALSAFGLEILSRRRLAAVG